MQNIKTVTKSENLPVEMMENQGHNNQQRSTPGLLEQLNL